MANKFPGLKLIFKTGSVNEPDDLTYPWKLEGVFRAPDFMNVAWAFLHGGQERIVVRGKTKEELERWVKAEGLDTHPRLVGLTYTNTDEKKAAA